MQRLPHSDPPKTTKFDVLMLSEADVAFLNNESPAIFNEEYPTAINGNNPASSIQQQATTYPLLPTDTTQEHPRRQTDSTPVFIPVNSRSLPVLPTAEKSVSHQHSPFSSEIQDSTDPVFSSISETRFYQPVPRYNSDDIDDVLNKIVVSEPLLTEDDLLYLIKKDYTGHVTPTRRLLKQALLRNGLHTEYKRLQAYMSGKVYE